ncbi:hypothetical protein CH379_008640 [Leptospira ellisii]|uniref:Uncharacterized protein n=1 Tax=Leptospira ellisii TaxID=2023197 RepID=A0A2N0BPW5_9LEPT|nr:hypothetical protein [Leptospira ellisii]MDV6235691.1 hypothetical protein [Leptospira ellisii]PJZ92672.1 hypothetical protein CH379_11940 [Leptospira ellisii]PKA05985.1 hypothetical protein CH375_02120 [Leptospira ellisii]
MKRNRSSILIPLFVFMESISCMYMYAGNDFVIGTEAIRKIQEEILIISLYETAGMPSLNQNASCNDYGSSVNPPDIYDDTEPNDVYSAAQTLIFNSAANPFAEISGNINAGGDVDVFRIRTSGTGSLAPIRFERDDPGQANCRISSGTDESVNASGVPTGFVLDLPPVSRQTLEVGDGTFNSAYIGCDGAPGQSYRIFLADESYAEIDQASAANLRLFKALIAPANFTTALKLKPDGKYTQKSLDVCVEEIHKSGYVLAVWNYNVQMMQRCLTGPDPYEYARVLLLYSACKLKRSDAENLDKIYGTGSI